MKIRLNLGCGKDIRKGWVNCDKYPSEEDLEKVMEIDLEHTPLPFASDYADEILLNHVFEHLHVNQYSLMKELSRILKKGGILRINVPVQYQSMEHENIFFTKEYFRALKTKPYGNLFRDIKVTWSKNGIRDMVWKIKLFLFWITAHEVKYELRK